MSVNIFSRLALPDLVVTPEVVNLTDSKRRRLLRGVATLRKMAEAEIDRLLDFLDRTEIDSDFEPVGDMEPSLGYLAGLSLYGGTFDDAEEGDDTGIGDHDGLIEQTTGEPTLGATEFQSSSDHANWGAMSPKAFTSDGELEPNLGSRECAGRHSQTFWAAGAADDRERPDSGLE